MRDVFTYTHLVVLDLREVVNIAVRSLLQPLKQLPLDGTLQLSGHQGLLLSHLLALFDLQHTAGWGERTPSTNTKLLDMEKQKYTNMYEVCIHASIRWNCRTGRDILNTKNKKTCG